MANTDMEQIVRKPIKIHWVTPNGKHYDDTVNMSLDEYTNFVDSLLELKKANTK